MHSLFFTNEYLLQSVGWAIINSFWQAGFVMDHLSVCHYY